MATSFDADVRIGAPPDAVALALADPRFYPTLGELPAIARPEVLEHEARGGRVHLRVRYRFDAHLPAAARRVVDPDRILWVDETVIDVPARRATFRIMPEHYGDRFACTGGWELTADGDATRQRVTGDVAVRLPVVGRLAERGIVRGLQENLAHEARLVEDWVAAQA